MTELKTERLCIRNLRLSDAKAYLEFQNSLFVQQYNVMRTMTMEDAQRYLQENCEDDSCLAIADGDGNFVGEIHVDQDSLRFRVCSLELSYWLGEPYSRKGYMTEALRAVIDHCFQNPELEGITIRCFAENAASLALIKKLGFHQEGYLRRAIKGYQGKAFDDTLHRLERENWECSPM